MDLVNMLVQTFLFKTFSMLPHHLFTTVPLSGFPPVGIENPIRKNMQYIRAINLTAVWGRELCCVRKRRISFLEVWVHFGPDEITWPLSHREPPGLNRRFELEVWVESFGPTQIATHFWNQRISNEKFRTEHIGAKVSNRLVGRAIWIHDLAPLMP